MAFKPDRHNAASPYLLVRDAEAELIFIEQAFDGERVMLHRRPNGTVQHAEIRIDDSIIMIGEVPEGAAANVHLYVPDVDASFARALAAGGTTVQEVEERGDGDRRGGIRDSGDITWWVSTHIGRS